MQLWTAFNNEIFYKETYIIVFLDFNKCINFQKRAFKSLKVE